MTTKTATHTPGPWSHPICDVSAGIFANTHGIEIQICRTINGVSEDEREANARLIASAPELLEALEYAQELIGVARRHFPKSIQNSDTFQLENTCAAVGKAIRKARNED